MPTYDLLVQRTVEATVRVQAPDEHTAVRAAEVAPLPAGEEWNVVPKSTEIREDVVQRVEGQS
jgi:hypothetical protein